DRHHRLGQIARELAQSRAEAAGEDGDFHFGAPASSRPFAAAFCGRSAKNPGGWKPPRPAGRMPALLPHTARPPQSLERPQRALESLQRRRTDALAILDRDFGHAVSAAMRNDQHVDWE